MERDCISEDCQILTNIGFLYLDQMIEQYENNPDLRIAAYNHEKEQIVYEKPTELIVNPSKKKVMYEFTHPAEEWRWESNSYSPYRNSGRNNDDRRSNGLSIVVTPRHDMFVERGRFDNSGGFVVSGKAPGFRKEKAQDIVPLTGNMECKRSASRFLAYARNGIENDDASLPFIERLNLKNDDQIDAFLRLYGYWLGDGSMRIRIKKQGQNRPDAITFAPVKKQDHVYLDDLLKRLDLTIDTDYITCLKKSGEKEYLIRSERYVKYFRSQYHNKYSHCKNSLNVDEVDDVELQDPEDIKSAKWLWYWWKNLNQSQCAALISGLRFADGSETAKKNIIYTSSIRFRDEIMHLLIHAGYSAYFTCIYKKGADRGSIKGVISNHDSWEIRYGLKTVHKPSFEIKDIKKVEYFGRTWCVSVPSQKIIARRAMSNDDGEIVKASRPIVIGNCMISHGASEILHERLFYCSDYYQMYICSECGLPATNKNKNRYWCKGCNTDKVCKIELPYACKLFLQELEALCITPRIRIKNNQPPLVDMGEPEGLDLGIRLLEHQEHQEE